MAVRIAQASKGESGYSGQKAGNQTGGELNIRSWYSRPWNVVLRAKDQKVASRIAEFMEAVVASRLVGYDQINRLSLTYALMAVGYDVSKLTKPVECDCSSLVTAAVIAAGIQVAPDLWTGNMQQALVATGAFSVLSEDIYTGMDMYLQRGDILLNTWHHVAVALDNGRKVTPSKTVNYAVCVNVSPGSYLTVRTSPEVRTDNLFVVQGQAQRLVRGQIVAIVEEKNGWGRIGNIGGWISLSYCLRAN